MCLQYFGTTSSCVLGLTELLRRGASLALALADGAGAVQQAVTGVLEISVVVASVIALTAAAANFSSAIKS